MKKRAAVKRRSRKRREMKAVTSPSVMLGLLNGTSMMLIGDLLKAAHRKPDASEERAMFLNAVSVLRSLKDYKKEVLQHCVLSFDVARLARKESKQYNRKTFDGAAAKLSELIATHWKVRVDPSIFVSQKRQPDNSEEVELGFDPDELPQVEFVPLTDEMSTEDIATDSMTGEEYDVLVAAEQEAEEEVEESVEGSVDEDEEPEPEGEDDSSLAKFRERQKRGAYDLVDD